VGIRRQNESVLEGNYLEGSVFGSVGMVRVMCLLASRPILIFVNRLFLCSRMFAICTLKCHLTSSDTPKSLQHVLIPIKRGDEVLGSTRSRTLSRIRFELGPPEDTPAVLHLRKLRLLKAENRLPTYMSQEFDGDSNRVCVFDLVGSP
jgi:hypothetical protein